MQFGNKSDTLVQRTHILSAATYLVNSNVRMIELGIVSQQTFSTLLLLVRHWVQWVGHHLCKNLFQKSLETSRGPPIICSNSKLVS